jgi:hypothetical protein
MREQRAVRDPPLYNGSLTSCLSGACSQTEMLAHMVDVGHGGIFYRGNGLKGTEGDVLTTLSSCGAVCWNHLRNDVRRVVRFGCIPLDQSKNILAMIPGSNQQRWGSREMGKMKVGILDFTCKFLPHQTDFVLYILNSKVNSLD